MVNMALAAVSMVYITAGLNDTLREVCNNEVKFHFKNGLFRANNMRYITYLPNSKTAKLGEIDGNVENILVSPDCFRYAVCRRDRTIWNNWPGSWLEPDENAAFNYEIEVRGVYTETTKAISCVSNSFAWDQSNPNRLLCYGFHREDDAAPGYFLWDLNTDERRMVYRILDNESGSETNNRNLIDWCRETNTFFFSTLTRTFEFDPITMRLSEHPELLGVPCPWTTKYSLGYWTKREEDSFIAIGNNEKRSTIYFDPAFSPCWIASGVLCASDENGRFVYFCEQEEKAHIPGDYFPVDISKDGKVLVMVGSDAKVSLMPVSQLKKEKVESHPY